jgi:hypothetical protein
MSPTAIMLAPLGVGLDRLKHGANVLLDTEAAEDRGFLRQIADAEARALVHRQRCHVESVEFDAAFVGLDQAGHHIEDRRLAGAVGPEQADRFAFAHVEAHPLDDFAADEGLLQAVDRQQAPAFGRRRAVSVRSAAWPGRGRRRNFRSGLRGWRRRRRTPAARLLHRRRHAGDIEIGAVYGAAHGRQVDRLLLGHDRLATHRTAAAKI